MYLTIRVEWTIDHFILGLIQIYPLSAKTCAKKWYLHFHSQGPRHLDLKFAHLVTLVQRKVATKLEVFMAFLFQENQRYQMDGWTDRWGQCLMWLAQGRPHN